MTPDVRGCRGFVAGIFASLSLSALVALPASAQNEITIGAPLPLTGALSPEGEKLRAGYEASGCKSSTGPAASMSAASSTR